MKKLILTVAILTSGMPIFASTNNIISNEEVVIIAMNEDI